MDAKNRTDNMHGTGETMNICDTNHTDDRGSADIPNQMNCLPNQIGCEEARRAPKWILYGIAAAVAVSFIAIAAGLVIHSGDEGMKASEVFDSWVEFFTGEDGEKDEDAGSVEEGQAETEKTARHAVHLALSGPDGDGEPDGDGGPDEDAGNYVLFRQYEDDVTDEYGFGDSTGLALRFWDEGGGHTELLVDGNVRCFLTVGETLFYTMALEGETRCFL